MILGLNLQMILTRTLLSITEVLQLNYNYTNTHSEIFSNRAIVKNLAKFPGKRHEVFQSFRSARGLSEKYFAKFFRITFFDTSQLLLSAITLTVTRAQVTFLGLNSNTSTISAIIFWFWISASSHTYFSSKTTSYTAWGILRPYTPTTIY